MRVVHVVAPDGIDDPARPSGGNTYDRRVCQELRSSGWSVHEYAVPGFWSLPGRASFEALEAVLQRIPDNGTVLLDGLIASTAPEVLVPQARRLHVVVLVHMPLGHRPPDGDADGVRRREHAALSAAPALVTTSRWARHRLVELYELPAKRIHVAEPGVEAAEPARGTPTGGALLCVATVSYSKGHDVLLDALAAIRDLVWRCVCVGPLDREPAFVEVLHRRSAHRGLDDRVSFVGARTGEDLDRAYASADVLVLPSRAETYGMVVTEALARGLPVIAGEVGGVSEALGRAPDGDRPGVLVPAGDAPAFATALRAWLSDGELRARLRLAARQRRLSVSPWSTTASAVAEVLAEGMR